MLKNITRNLVNNFTPRKAERARSDSGQVQPHILRTALVVFTLALLSACGGEPMEPTDAAVDNPTDGEEWCSNALMVDNFEDGNLSAELLGGNWQAFEGSRIINSDGILRVEGNRPNPDGYIGVELRIPLGSPADVRSYDTFFVDVKVGSVSDPSIQIRGKIKVEVEGYCRAGSSTSRFEEDFLSGETFITEHVVFSDPNPDLNTEYLIRAGIYFQPPDDGEYFIEINNVKLCLTGWPPFFS